MSVGMQPEISIIIPTHNRQDSLKRLLDNIFGLSANVSFEIVVVDNNSKDKTKEVVQSYKHDVCYVFEKNTSFTRARHTGAQHARGNIFVYLDDDVVVKPGTLEEVLRLFTQEPTCGVAGGKIIPRYEQEPPQWVLNLQRSFNGLSLYDVGDRVREVGGVPGPLMAIRKSAFDAVGGFPPDTVGVETNSAHKTFKKLYIGPGDYGFCVRCKELGFKIMYSPQMSVEHVIPPIRLSQDFWSSRMIGEGHCAALTRSNMKEFKLRGAKKIQTKLSDCRNLALHYLKAKLQRIKGDKSPLLPDEMWMKYYASLLSMERVLNTNPELSSYLWELGAQGVADKDFDSVLAKLPRAYQKLAL